MREYKILLSQAQTCFFKLGSSYKNTVLHSHCIIIKEQCCTFLTLIILINALHELYVLGENVFLMEYFYHLILVARIRWRMPVRIVSIYFILYEGKNIR